MSFQAISRRDLETVLRAVESGDLACPFGRADLQSLGLGHLSAALTVLDGLDRQAVCVVLRQVIAERGEHRGAEVELVWTGPEAAGSTARDTLVVVRRMFEEARCRVIVAGYVFTKGTEILRPLHAAMRDHGVEVQVFMDIHVKAPSSAQVEEHVRRYVETSFRRWWTFGDPTPSVFYFDPRTADPSLEGANLHAKCVVVDARQAFLGSANFTEWAHKRNIEAGVLVRDRGFAERLAAQWTGLVEVGLVRRCPD